MATISRYGEPSPFPSLAGLQPPADSDQIGMTTAALADLADLFGPPDTSAPPAWVIRVRNRRDARLFADVTLCPDRAADHPDGVRAWAITGSPADRWAAYRVSRAVSDATRPAPPPPPDLGFRVSGVEVSYVGEDGDVVAHGHVDPDAFLAAADCMAREVTGERGLWGGQHDLAGLRERVRHRWAVSKPAKAAAEGLDWWLTCHRIGRCTRGAFPVTYLSA